MEHLNLRNFFSTVSTPSTWDMARLPVRHHSALQYVILQSNTHMYDIALILRITYIIFKA